MSLIKASLAMAMAMRLGLAPAFLLYLMAPSARADDAASQAARVQAERAAVQSRFESRERECNARFVVNACMDEARKQRRDALAVLKRQQIALDEAERKRRAAQRQADLRTKMEAHTARRQQGEDVPVVSTRKPAEPKRAASAPSRQAATARSAAHEQAQREQRSQSQQRKLQAAEAHRAAVNQRNAERAAKGKLAAAPLPIPGPVPGLVPVPGAASGAAGAASMPR